MLVTLAMLAMLGCLSARQHWICEALKRLPVWWDSFKSTFAVFSLSLVANGGRSDTLFLSACSD